MMLVVVLRIKFMRFMIMKKMIQIMISIMLTKMTMTMMVVE